MVRITTIRGGGGGAPRRSFSTTFTALAPPKGKFIPFAKNKLSNNSEDGLAGQATTSLLQEMTLPTPSLSHIEEFQPETLTKESIGKVRAFSKTTMDSFSTLTIPTGLKNEFAFNPRPSTVIRSSTLAIAGLLDEARKGSSKSSRTVLSGGEGTGKSVTLLQAISYAQATNWVVLYLPSATPLIDSSTPHLYSSQAGTYSQPAFSLSLLKKFAAVNKVLLKELKTKEGKSLLDLVTKGVEEKNSSEILETMFEELGAQTKYPVLLAIDDAQSLFNTSLYVDPTYKKIESYHLSIPRLLLSYISGAKTFSSGTVLLSPSSLSPFPSPALSSHLSSTPLSPFASPITSTYSPFVSSLKILPIEPRLNRKEAVGLVELLKGFRGTREGGVDDSVFMEVMIGGDGNVGKVRKGLGRVGQL